MGHSPFSETWVRHLPGVRYLCSRQEIFPGGSDDKESAYNGGDQGLIHESGRSPREGNGNPLQYSCLENSMDRETWRAIVNEVARVGQDLATNHRHHIEML